VSYGADGKPTACDITSSSGTPELDEATCKSVMRRARFTPGKDENGQPVGASFSSRVKWVIPK